MLALALAAARGAPRPPADSGARGVLEGGGLP